MERSLDFKYDLITSRQNSLVLYACKLADKKYRQKEGKFRLDGIKLCREAFESGVEIETVFVMESAAKAVFESIGDFLMDAAKKNIDVKVVSDGVFEKISEEKAPQGVICIARRIDKFHKIATINNMNEILEPLLEASNGFFAVESVRDPGNLGTIIRSATAFGVDYLLISSDCAELYNPKTIRAAMGTLFKQRIVIVDKLSEAVALFSRYGRKVYAAALSNDSVMLGDISLSRRDCIVVGNEGHGLSEELISACEGTLLIPMTPNAESLNAAIASSVCMWEQFGRNL